MKDEDDDYWEHVIFKNEKRFKCDGPDSNQS